VPTVKTRGEEKTQHMRALLARAAQLHSISSTLSEDNETHAYLLRLAQLSGDQLYRYMIQAMERAEPQTRLVPVHIPKLATECSGRYWQGTGRRQTRRVSSSRWRVHGRCIVDGSGACAPSLTAALVWLHRPAASASARLHRHSCRRANVDGFLLLLLAFR
jgi:hypothetical protein